MGLIYRESWGTEDMGLIYRESWGMEDMGLIVYFIVPLELHIYFNFILL